MKQEHQGKRVVITGSTRGIGLGLAEALLARGCAVLISGRSEASTAAACARLEPAGRVFGQPADVRHLAELERLWDTVVDRLGGVDVWINNAGLGHDLEPVWQLPAERVAAVIETNLLGAAYGSQVALRGMLAQGFGQLFNMEGAGSNGRVRRGMGVYSATKAGLHVLNEALILEAAGMPVRVGRISPGMVVTDMLLDPVRQNPQAMPGARRVFNILADRVETVAPWLADQILANEKHGADIRWLTRGKILWRFLSAPLQRRNVLQGL